MFSIAQLFQWHTHTQTCSHPRHTFYNKATQNTQKKHYHNFGGSLAHTLNNSHPFINACMLVRSWTTSCEWMYSRAHIYTQYRTQPQNDSIPPPLYLTVPRKKFNTYVCTNKSYICTLKWKYAAGSRIVHKSQKNENCSDILAPNLEFMFWIHKFSIPLRARGVSMCVCVSMLVHTS